MPTVLRSTRILGYFKLPIEVSNMAKIDQIIPEISTLDGRALEILEVFFTATEYDDEFYKDYLSWKSTILMSINKEGDALLILDELLSKINIKDHRYTNANLNKIQCLITLDKYNEADNLIFEQISNVGNNRFEKLAYLNLSLKTNTTSQLLPRNIQNFADSVFDDFGIDINSNLSYYENVKQLLNTIGRSDRNYSSLVFSLEQTVSLAERQMLVESFCYSEKSKYYIEMAKGLRDSNNT